VVPDGGHVCSVTNLVPKHVQPLVHLLHICMKSEKKKTITFILNVLKKSQGVGQFQSHDTLKWLVRMS